MSVNDSFGKALDLSGVSLSSFLASISTSVAVFTAELLLYFILSDRISNIYRLAQPDTSLFREAAFKFIHFRWHEGENLDTYFFRRYLRALVLIFLPSSLVITPVLASLNFYNTTQRGISGLDQLGWSNLNLDHTDRYWVHLFFSICFTAYVCWIIWNELHLYVQIHQSARSSALRTILIDSIPESWKDEAKLREQLACFGVVVSVSFNQNFSDLRGKLRQRQLLTEKLEKAETRLLRLMITGATASNAILRGVYKSSSQWPSVETLRSRLVDLNKEIDDLATTLPILRSAFVTFDTPMAAHMACQSVIHSDAGYMTPRTLPTSQSDIIWDNVSMTWRTRTIRAVICNTIIVLLSLLCAVPISLSSLLSQAIYLSRLSFLQWLQGLPEWSLGVIQGIMPPICLAIFLRLFSESLVILVKEQGIPLRSLVSLKIQDYYFFFLLIQVTLSVTFSAGITAFMSNIITERRFAATLGKNLPKASNYFLSYVILQSLSVSASALLRLDRLIDIKIIGPLRDHTVTQMMDRRKVPDVEWGKVVPVYTNIACIGMLYAIISPIIIPFEFLIFFISWWIHLRPFEQMNQHDHGGAFYPKAIKHLFVGLYIMESSLIVLFLLVRNSRGQATCVGQAVLSVLAIALTAVYHFVIRGLYDPLLKFLPTSTQNSQSGHNAEFGGRKDIAATFRLPKDSHGFTREELERCSSLLPGVFGSLADATIDDKGHIQLAD